MELLDTIMTDTTPWIGLGAAQRNVQLSKIQINLDEIAASLIQYSADFSAWDYLDFKGIVLLVLSFQEREVH